MAERNQNQHKNAHNVKLSKYMGSNFLNMIIINILNT